MSTRRDFIKQTAWTAAGLAAGARFGGAFTRPAGFSSATEKSRIVVVRNPAVVDAAGKVQADLLPAMLDKAITAFTGHSSAADSWRRFISPEDIVGLKINTLGNQDVRGTDYTQHFSAVIGAIAAGLRNAGVPDKNIVVWDRSEEEMMDAGLTIQRDPGAMRFIANKAGRRDPGDYAETTYPVGSQSSRVSRILAEVCTSMVNIVVPKTHGMAVFTGSLKNHYGTVDNPNRMHQNGCTNPGIPEVNTIPIIRKKQKLIIGDALLMVTENGPRWDRRFIRPFGGILVGTDPVAFDTVAVGLLDGLRKADGMEPIAPRVSHIALSEQLGLGKGRLSDIDVVTVNLG